MAGKGRGKKRENKGAPGAANIEFFEKEGLGEGNKAHLEGEFIRGGKGVGLLGGMKPKIHFL